MASRTHFVSFAQSILYRGAGIGGLAAISLCSDRWESSFGVRHSAF
jgi:hypothetical protein